MYLVNYSAIFLFVRRNLLYLQFFPWSYFLNVKSVNKFFIDKRYHIQKNSYRPPRKSNEISHNKRMWHLLQSCHAWIQILYFEPLRSYFMYRGCRYWCMMVSVVQGSRFWFRLLAICMKLNPLPTLGPVRYPSPYPEHHSRATKPHWKLHFSNLHHLISDQLVNLNIYIQV